MYSDYELIVKPGENDLGPVFFIASYQPTGIDHRVKVNITCRSVLQYPSVPINPDWQYLEIGPGVAEFIPNISKITRKKPIVIEMLDYELLVTMLSGDNHEYQSLFETLCKRIAIYRNSAEVRLVNKPVGEAAKDTSLHGIADVVIDWAGAGSYADTELVIEDLQGDRRKLRKKLELKIEAYERLFLKPGGIYITSPSFRR